MTSLINRKGLRNPLKTGRPQIREHGTSGSDIVYHIIEEIGDLQPATLSPEEALGASLDDVIVQLDFSGTDASSSAAPFVIDQADVSATMTSASTASFVINQPDISVTIASAPENAYDLWTMSNKAEIDLGMGSSDIVIATWPEQSHSRLSANIEQDLMLDIASHAIGDSAAVSPGDFSFVGMLGSTVRIFQIKTADFSMPGELIHEYFGEYGQNVISEVRRFAPSGGTKSEGWHAQLIQLVSDVASKTAGRYRPVVMVDREDGTFGLEQRLNSNLELFVELAEDGKLGVVIYDKDRGAIDIPASALFEVSSMVEEYVS